MKLFLKLLPYLLIISLGFGIYFGFTYMSNKVAETEKREQCLILEKEELKSQLESLQQITNISTEQLTNIMNNEKESLQYINDNNFKINALQLNKIDDIMLKKINDYQDCMAKNSLKPNIKCELEI